MEAFWQRVRRRLEEGGATVRLGPAEDAEVRQQVARLLGVPGRYAGTWTVRLDELDRALAPRGGLAGVVGPVTDRRAARAAALGGRADAWGAAELAVPAQLHGWLQEQRRRSSTVSSAELMAAAGRVLAVLPLADDHPAGRRSLGVLAAEVCGDPHALDAGRPLPGLVLSGLARLLEREVPRSAAARRALWAEAGVAVDDVSCDVLVLNLGRLAVPGASDAAGAGDPLRVTLRALRRAVGVVGPPPLVRVVENPGVVVAAADALGRACPPLVCAGGVPNGAVLHLLKALIAAGSAIAVHTDFDWGGIRIANAMVCGLGAEPWRMRAADYRGAPPGDPLAGRPVRAAWDPLLTEAMVARGVGSYEEQVVEVLLTDLQASDDGRGPGRDARPPA